MDTQLVSPVNPPSSISSITASSASIADIQEDHQAPVEDPTGDHLNHSVDDSNDVANETNSPSVGDLPEPPVYESYPETRYAELQDHESFPQVVLDRNNLPQVQYGIQPEAWGQETMLDTSEHTKPPKKICGLPKLWFWITTSGIATLGIIAVIVGGVLGARAGSSKPETSFLPTTHLAAVNYTEPNAWDSNLQEWQVSPLNPKEADGPSIKPGTPLAAYTFGDQQLDRTEYHVFFLDTDNKLWERGSLDAADMWSKQTDNVVQGQYTVSADSKLTAYARQCERYCSMTSVLAWQGSAGRLWFAGYVGSDGWWAHEASGANNNNNPDQTLISGSALSLTPIWANQTSLLALYGNTNSGKLARFVFNTTDKWEEGWSFNDSFPGPLAPEANLAGFAQSYFGANDTMGDVEFVATRPGNTSKGGALSWDSNYSSDNLFNNSAVDTFSAVSNFSAIAATAGGNVYAIEEDQLIEWEWQHGNRSYLRRGVVNTDIKK
ncbi:uncharacterized protein K452DRAFT_310441 [Aplosporella prunicola CBS 121167]|uniref:Fucose-specific lectin n=1 Tax=Aplosporella prunicola CBS 121167 TaxID=1176127 RepID=A0A6A6B788_9PEZI|nr:uncharacterized protein K452DRAFT_310441 [Aplosporella prunicola CBS 121167]KAF2139478.1 hypothetical protein K452DRAFT_310441 [Aplosporella prunicola CBS 121167]